MFGTGATVPVPDVDRTDHLLILGANPLASNGCLLTAPDMRGRLRAIRARGGKVVVVDPRRTRTAREADEHHFIRPGTDALLLFALAHTLFDEEPRRPRPLAPHLAGARRGPRAGRRALARGGRGDVRDRRGRDPPHGPRAGGRAERRGLRAHRHHHAGVRDAGELAGRRAQRAHRQPRPAGRRDVPARRAGASNTAGEPGRGRGAAFGRWTAACAAWARSSASCRWRAWPRRSRRRARARSAR